MAYSTDQIVDTPDLKAHLNITTSDDDALLAAYLDAARGVVEGWCGPFNNYEGGDFPPALVHAVKMYAGHLYENREASTFSGSATEVPMGFFELIGPHRKWAFYDGEG
ncbi:head-tail connector protein [Xanthobacter sp. 126]|uniref:head-tail connector protein n=1 Tax=Xanthobacter sp. 126 TaxID=1131814 RepID=UPI0004A5DA62|nr:head-tail connector protein [Xanthobacter sp. 126]